MDMEQWARVRRKILVDGQSKRSVMSEEGLHWESLQKMLSHSRPPGYRRLNKRVRKIDGYVEWIRQIMGCRPRSAAQATSHGKADL